MWRIEQKWKYNFRALQKMVNSRYIFIYFRGIVYIDPIKFSNLKYWNTQKTISSTIFTLLGVFATANRIRNKLTLGLNEENYIDKLCRLLFANINTAPQILLLFCWAKFENVTSDGNYNKLLRLINKHLKE